MVQNNALAYCPLCGGRKTSGTTTFSVDLGFGVIVIRDVPALVCQQCGADWIEEDVAARLGTIVEDARRRQHPIEVMGFANQEVSV